jgi:hypothetical protein
MAAYDDKPKSLLFRRKQADFKIFSAGGARVSKEISDRA